MKYYKLLLVAGIILFAIGCKPKATEANAAPQWKIGIQTYSFHKFTLMEALDKSKQLGLTYAEAYFGQTLGKSFADTAYLDMTIADSVRIHLKNEFQKRDIKLHAFGVASYGTTAEWEQFFAFAKDMGVHTITCEPALDQLDFVEQLALKHGIEVAIHNHPTPSVYADPAVLLKALEGRNPIMGVCADIGHWKRAGNEPIATLKKFAGRIKVLHIKDLSEGLEDTSWGTGVLSLKGVLEELHAQQFDGLLSVEYENFGDTQLDDMVKSIDYYKQVTAGLK